MNKVLLSFLSILLLITIKVNGHMSHYDHTDLREWNFNNGTPPLRGSFYMIKDGYVYIEDDKENILKFPVNIFSEADRTIVNHFRAQIETINHRHELLPKYEHQILTLPSPFRFLLPMILFLLTLGIVVIVKKRSRRPVFLLGSMGSLGIFILSITTANSSNQSTTDPAFIDSAFAPFIPEVHTYYDLNYFYVESKGIPTTHQMMVGISNHGWQQQVPIPQCYIGNNAWPIPLNPVLATNPIPVDSIHFTRGAIAIAANGVPIFNVHTNTGVDSYVDGQLDNFGGHCGRADDYHYHIAPLHLYNYTSTSLPIAFGLDGYAIYGSVEPDGSPMSTLDANHGHFGNNGVYHYHGTASAPYMIARMAGQVTEDTTHQLVPQAAAQPVRPALTPLNGALITDCSPNANNDGYTLTYTLAGATDSIVYYWNTTGRYTFNFYTASGLTTNIYNRFAQCSVPTALNNVKPYSNIKVYPTLAHDYIRLDFDGQKADKIEILDATGRTIKASNEPVNLINIETLSPGLYFIQIENAGKWITKKFVKE